MAKSEVKATRKTKAKPPQFRVWHNKREGIMYWRDAGIPRWDGRAIDHALTPLLEVLEERGFDVHTLRISVRKREVVE